MTAQRPQVGVGIMIIKDGKILLGKRRGTHGAGEYAGVGGHIENMESFEDCALREMAEEIGPHITIKNLRLLCVTNLRKYAPKHYVDIGMVAEWVSGEPKVMEPHRIEAWEWFDMANVPKPIFGSIANYIEAYETGQYYFDD